MSGNQVFTWPTGLGWIVIGGRTDGSGMIRAQVLERANADGGVAYISFMPDGGDSIMDDMDDLGAPTGYVIDVFREDIETIEEYLRDISVIVIQGGGSLDAQRTSLSGRVEVAIRGVFERGGILFLEGTAANVFGQWVLDDAGMLAEGLAWLKPLVIDGASSSLEQSRVIPMVFEREPLAIGVGLGVESALAFGPDGQMETWGRRQVTISLGSGYENPAN